jgi:hypothetical protein
MRWSWRADLLPVVLDALLEGSLVGVAYTAIALLGANATAPLSLVEFCLVAAAGLVWARLRPRAASRVAWIASAALLAGVLGWLADPAARAALATLDDPLGALLIHPAGCLLGVAVLRGAVHEHADDEIETSTRALAYAFPVLAASWLPHLRSGGPFVGPALVGSAVCVAAGLLAIGHARLRELELLGSESRGGRTWAMVATGVVVAVAALGIPIALLSGTSARDMLTAVGGPVGGAIGLLLAPLGGLLVALAAAIGQVLNDIHLPSLSGAPGSVPTSGTAAGSPGGSHGVSPVGGPVPGGSLPLGWLVLVGVVAVIVLLAIGLRRLAVNRPSPPDTAPPREERHREVRPPRLNLHLPRLAIHPHVLLPRRPASAPEAYLALLDELAGRGEVGRRPAETPQAHAERAGALGLPRRPLGLLAADYELAVYGRAAIGERETARAIGRWRQLRRAARTLPHHGSAP